MVIVNINRQSLQGMFMRCRRSIDENNIPIHYPSMYHLTRS
ncbi:hypothetical protein LOK49_LG07G01053 [Camellia lanceoleosa]|uniref:Uncharacterized protein n=1 Tax=Camellia lanceoleosa TaxID=1840588 RepID=A0ACC0H8X1_9ERIC|nr:hypothetical protein LOK49_LG07G01053 [Camellia lanceoleosa]